MHRFQTPVDVPLEHHLAKHPNLSRFVLLLQSQIRLLPVRPDAPALEAFHLAIHLFAGVGGSLFAQLDRCQRLALLLIHRLQHLELDRQTVAVPARYVAHSPSVQHLIFVDDVLQHLVEGMPHVQSTVGVGRAVMEGEGWAAVVQAQLAVDAVVFPEALQFRFALDGIGAHAESRLQQIEGVFVGGAFLSGGVARLLAHGVPALASGLSVFALWRCDLGGFG